MSGLPRRSAERRILRVVLAAVALTVVASGCNNGGERASFAGGVGATTEEASSSPDVSTTSTTLAAESLVLSPDGLGPVPFGTQAAVALSGLTQALGRAENWTPVTAGATCGATRVFTWKNFDVIVNEATAASGGMRGLVGWRVRDTAPTFLDLKTEKGIGLGSTVAAVRAAYGDSVSMAQGDQGPVLTMTAASGVITADLDGGGDLNTVRSLRAGASCAG